MGQSGESRLRPRVVHVLVGLLTLVVALGAAGSSTAAYWFFRGEIGTGAGSTFRVSPNGKRGAQYVRMTWNGHFLYGCTVLISRSGTWDTRCRYASDARGDYELRFNPRTYGQAGCRNPAPQQAYWANCRRGGAP